MNTLSLILMLLGVAVFVAAIRLHYAIARGISAENASCLEHKTDLYRAAHGAMFLSAAYVIAEARWLIMELDAKIPTFDDIIWNVLEAGFLGYVAWCCHIGRKMLKSRWAGCTLTDV